LRLPPGKKTIRIRNKAKKKRAPSPFATHRTGVKKKQKGGPSKEKREGKIGGGSHVVQQSMGWVEIVCEGIGRELGVPGMRHKKGSGPFHERNSGI